jgi:hypothetical protein
MNSSLTNLHFGFDIPEANDIYAAFVPLRIEFSRRGLVSLHNFELDYDANQSNSVA